MRVLKPSRRQVTTTLYTEQSACKGRASLKTGESNEEKNYKYSFNLRVTGFARFRARFIVKAQQLFCQNQPKDFYRIN